MTAEHEVERLAQVLAEAHAAYIEDEADADDLPDYFASFLSERGVTQPDTGLREADVLRANLASTADWLDAIIEESDPKPSELMAMVAGIRAALRSTPAAPKEDDRE